MSRICHQLYITMIILALAVLGSWAMAQEKGTGPGNAMTAVERAELIKILEKGLVDLETVKKGAIAEFDVILIEKRKQDKEGAEEDKKKLEADNETKTKEFNSKIKGLLAQILEKDRGGELEKIGVDNPDFDPEMAKIGKDEPMQTTLDTEEDSKEKKKK